MGLKKYNLYMSNDDIDRVVLLLSGYQNIEIREVNRRIGIIQIKAEEIGNISDIPQILNIEIDTKFYINRIAII